MNQYNKAIELYNNGLSLRKIEEQTGINRKKMSRFLKDLLATKES